MTRLSICLAYFFIGCSAMNYTFADNCVKELQNHERYDVPNFSMTLCIKKAHSNVSCSVRRHGPIAPERGELYITTSNPKRQYREPIWVSDDIRILNSQGEISLKFNINDHDMAPLAITCAW